MSVFTYLEFHLCVPGLKPGCRHRGISAFSFKKLFSLMSTWSRDLASAIFRILLWLLFHSGDLLLWERGYGKGKT